MNETLVADPKERTASTAAPTSPTPASAGFFGSTPNFLRTFRDRVGLGLGLARRNRWVSSSASGGMNPTSFIRRSYRGRAREFLQNLGGAVVGLSQHLHQINERGV